MFKKIFFLAFSWYYNIYSENHIFVTVRLKTFLTINSVFMHIIIYEIKYLFYLFEVNILYNSRVKYIVSYRWKKATLSTGDTGEYS